jgi:thymidylate synthase
MPPVTADWTGLEGLMTGVIAGAPPPNADEVWITFAQVMGSYRAWTGGDRDQARALAAGIRGELGNALRRWYDHLTATRLTATRTAGR